VQGVIEAIRERQIANPELLRWVMAAGAASNSVALNGRKAISMSCNGDVHVEPFPTR
jgi:hypothetical protein